MYTSLLSRGDIDQGFSIIYGDVFSDLQLASLKELFKEEPHIFDTMINGTFSVTFSIRGGNISKTFKEKYTNAIKNNTNCYNKNVTGSCSNCLADRYKNPLTNMPIFHVQNNFDTTTKRCVAPNSDSGIGFYPPFSFDSIVMIAHVYHDILHTRNKTAFDANDFMSVISNPSFSFLGATGKVMLDPTTGDRRQDGISMDIWNLITPSPMGDDRYRYNVGSFDIVGTNRNFQFCTFTNTNNLHGDGNLCIPKFVYNTKNGMRPDPIDRTLLNINLGIVTSTFKTNGNLPVTSNSPLILDASGNQRTLAILIAIDECNNRSNPLRKNNFISTPTIVYKWINSRRSESNSAIAGSEFLGNKFPNEGTDVVIGALSSGPSMYLQTVLKYQNILQISPSATSPVLADNKVYPSFARTVPSDIATSQMLIRFAKSMKWLEIGIVSTDTEYSQGGLTAIIDAASKSQIKISLNIAVDHGRETTMYQKAINALQSATRVFIVFLPDSDILMFSRSMEQAAIYLNVDISTISFIFSEAILSIPKTGKLPAILNGSFALKPNNGQELDMHKNMATSIKDKIAHVKSCTDKKAGLTMCDCIKKEWQDIFLFDHDDNATTPNQCSFPTSYNSQEYYTPFAYDAVLTIAHLYHNLITKTNVKKIENGKLKEYLMKPGQVVFKGASGLVSFDERGDRNIGNLKFSIYNIFNKLANNTDGNSLGGRRYIEQEGAFKNLGTMDHDGKFHFCNDNICKNFTYSTKDGKKPLSIIKACIKNVDCKGDSICSTYGQCICSPGRMGVNCQQFLFPERVAYQNKDGSERCLRFVRPRTFAFINHSTIRIAYDNWESQWLVSEIAHIVMKELM